MIVIDSLSKDLSKALLMLLQLVLLMFTRDEKNSCFENLRIHGYIEPRISRPK